MVKLYKLIPKEEFEFLVASKEGQARLSIPFMLSFVAEKNFTEAKKYLQDLADKGITWNSEGQLVKDSQTLADTNIIKILQSKFGLYNVQALPDTKETPKTENLFSNWITFR